MLEILLIVDCSITADYFVDKLQVLGSVWSKEEVGLYESVEEFLEQPAERKKTAFVYIKGKSYKIQPVEGFDTGLDQEDLDAIPMQYPRFYGMNYDDFEILKDIAIHSMDSDDIWVYYGLDEVISGGEFVARLKSGWRWNFPPFESNIMVSAPQ